MLKIENAEVLGWEHAIRGMRNPMNSWEKIDSLIIDCDGECSSCDAYELGSDDYCTFPLGENIVIGPNDRKLMTRLAKAGTDHRKFMRLPLYYGAAVFVEGVRYIQGGYGSQFLLYDAQNHSKGV